jgi:hypothetical protein
MVVTTRAGESQAKKRLADHVDLQIYDIHLQLPFVCIYQSPRSEAQKTGCDYLRPALIVRCVGQ